MQNNGYKEIDELITECLIGTIDGESLKRLKQWASLSDENSAYIRQQAELWFSASVLQGDRQFDKKKAYDRFLQRISEHKGDKKNVRLISWKALVRVAAIILLLVLPVLGYWQGERVVKQNFADIIIESPLGSRTKVNLPDGTLVWLNSGSKIVYSQGFGVENRCLEMEGEGYFEVMHNQYLPFEINTKEVSLRVLGTKFNFYNYPDDDEVVVDLMEGRVALHNEMKSMPECYLEPNEKLILDKYTGDMKKVKMNTAFSNTWINDELFFDEVLLEDIARRLMRSFAVRIEVADSLKNKRFYGSFKVQGNTIEKILEDMALTNQMNFKIENGKYIIY